MAISERLEIAKQNIVSAREYTLTLLDGLDDEQWFWTPELSVSHIAWQVGHLAMAQYGLTLFRQRGRSDIDGSLIPNRFRKRVMKGTRPESDPEQYLPPGEILQVLHRVHEQMLLEIDQFDGPGLDEPLDQPYSGFATRYGSLLFAANHEMLHAGQIGLLRRLMGMPPIR
ncbi:MAG: DinB family protein [Planctomycetota bacterium]|nr:DinB family protein [Planctomycetota bacterium]